MKKVSYLEITLFPFFTVLSIHLL